MIYITCDLLYIYIYDLCYQGGLPASCDLEKLKEHFGQFGEIHDAVVMMDGQTQRCPVT